MADEAAAPPQGVHHGCHIESHVIISPVTFKVVFAKQTFDISLPTSTTVDALQTQLEQLTQVRENYEITHNNSYNQVPVALQKLMFKGLLAGPGKPDLGAKTLAEACLTNGARVMLVGTTTAGIIEAAASTAAAKTVAVAVAGKAEGGVTSTPWAAMPVHKKVLDKGVPADAALAYRGADPLPSEPVAAFTKTGAKVRLAFKVAEQLLTLASKESTQQVPMGAVRRATSQPIPGHEEYHILCLQLGETAQSSTFYYWFPAQFTRAVKALFNPLALAFD